MKTQLYKYELHVNEEGLQKLYFPIHVSENHWIVGMVKLTLKRNLSHLVISISSPISRQNLTKKIGQIRNLDKFQKFEEARHNPDKNMKPQPAQLNPPPDMSCARSCEHQKKKHNIYLEEL